MNDADYKYIFTGNAIDDQPFIAYRLAIHFRFSRYHGAFLESKWIFPYTVKSIKKMVYDFFRN